MMSFPIAEVALYAAIPISVGGLAVLAWRMVLAPFGRLLELSENLSGAQTQPRRETASARASRVWTLKRRPVRVHGARLRRHP
jgi:hypothetical protein